MDFFSSMSSFLQDDDLIQFSSIPHQQHMIQEDALLVTPSQHNMDVTSKPCYSRRQKSAVAFGDIDDSPNDYKRKIIHRDVERQRRQEMGTLYRSLKSQLPLECLKGKRSISDHVHVAVNYIRHLQKNIEELSKKRDELKRLLDLDQNNISVESKFFPRRLLETVKVETSRARVQVFVRTALSAEVSVSRVLDLLICEGLNVVSCISTNINEGSLHVIESEVSDGRSINPSELQKKLTDLMI